MYQGVFRLIKLHLRHRLFNGGWSEIFTREVLERLTAAAVLPYDPKLDRVILIEQFRPGALNDPTGPWQIEIPAGVITDNHPPMDVAIREAQEEAGCEVYNLELIYDYFVSPGGANEYLHIFCGQVDASHVNGIHGLEHEHEDIKVHNIPAEQAFQMLKNRELKNAPIIMSLQWLFLNRERLQKEWKT
jgi:ADP-ribose pyrophosphatase